MRGVHSVECRGAVGWDKHAPLRGVSCPAAARRHANASAPMYSNGHVVWCRSQGAGDRGAGRRLVPGRGTRELWGQVTSSCLVWVVLASGCVTG